MCLHKPSTVIPHINDLGPILCTHLAAHAHTVIGLLFRELPVVVDRVLVYPSQLQTGQHAALPDDGLLLFVDSFHDLSRLGGMIAAVADIELHNAYIHI